MLKWELLVNKYTSARIAKLGEWKVFSVIYDRTKSRYEPCKYALKCKLPGITDNIGDFETEIEAMELAKKVLSFWLKRAGLTFVGKV